MRSQNSVIDSLENLLKTAKEDTVKAKLLDDLGWEYNSVDVKKAERCGKELLELSKKIKYIKGEGTAYANLGAVCYLQNKYPEAIQYFQQAADIRKSINDRPGTGGALNNIAMTYQQQSNYSTAVSFYIEALKIFEELKDEKRMAQTNNNIGSLYQELKNFPTSIKYTLKGLSGWQKLNHKAGISGSYVNIGNAYQALNNYSEARVYYEKALEAQKDLTNNNYSMARIYHNMGTNYIKLKDFEKAAQYLKLEIPLKEQSGDKEGISSAHHSLGQLYYLTKKYDLAVEAYLKTEKLAREIGNKDNLRWAYAGLKEAYWAKGKLDLALKYSTYYDQVKDSILNESSSRQIAEMQTKYETEKKEKENNELKRKTEVQQLQIKNEAEKRKNQMIIGLSAVAFLAASSLFLYNRRKLKQKAIYAAELAEEQKLRFKSVIEAEEKERSRIAQELHDGLGQMLSTARLNVAGLEDSIIPEDKEWLDKSLKIIDDACIEVRHISHNMMPSALIRLGLIPAIHELVNNINSSKQFKIDFNTNVKESLGSSLDITIYRIVQEVLNNMIKHSKADKINVGINKNDADLTINMKDNGIGFDTDKLKDSKGIGWKNIFSRVNMMDGTIKVESEPQKGTKVYINLKLKNG